MRSFPYTPDAAFSEEFLLHSASWFSEVFLLTPDTSFSEKFLLHSSGDLFY